MGEGRSSRVMRVFRFGGTRGMKVQEVQERLGSGKGLSCRERENGLQITTCTVTKNSTHITGSGRRNEPAIRRSRAGFTSYGLRSSFDESTNTTG